MLDTHTSLVYESAMNPLGIDLAAIRAACAVVYRYMPPTPQYIWPLLSRRLGAKEVWVKHENCAPTGAFKVRGGLVYMERLHRERPQVTGVISATRGNHGQSLAYAGREFGVRVVICVPHGNSAEKNAAMRAFGAELIEFGQDFDEARLHARDLASQRGLELVNSFHADLVLGVASSAHELFSAAPDLDLVYVPIGMGSNICGTIAVRDALGLKAEIVGVQAKGAPYYWHSFREQRVVTTEKATTRADGLATRMPDPLAVGIINRSVSRIVLVDDDAIAAAIRAYHTDTHTLAEGAGAAALAAAMQERDGHSGRRVGLILSGGNIDLELYKTWVVPA